MSRTARAVICRELNRPVRVESIEVDSPARDEVMIKVAACGVCHSDYSATNGTIRVTPPVILGHEGAGVVVEVGAGVAHLAAGDHVLSFVCSMCGHCRYCLAGRPTLCLQSLKAGAALPDGSLRTRDAHGHSLGIMAGCGVMSEYATLHVSNLIKIDPDVPLAPAALMSCAVVTGVGAVLTRARMEPGSIGVVFGIGGVGLNAVQGCLIAGARMIVAVDTSDEKLRIAREFGATHTVNAQRESNLVKAVRELTGGGADYSFECIGNGETVAQAYGVLARGGTAVVVGIAQPSQMTSIRTMTLPFEEKTLTGCYMGSARPAEDFPRLIRLHRAGQLKVDELITRTYAVEDAPQAFEDLLAGRNIRGVIRFP